MILGVCVEVHVPPFDSLIVARALAFALNVLLAVVSLLLLACLACGSCVANALLLLEMEAFRSSTVGSEQETLRLPMPSKQGTWCSRDRKSISPLDQDFVSRLYLVGVLLDCFTALEDVALPLPEGRLYFDRIDLDLLVLNWLLGHSAVDPLPVACRGSSRSLLANHLLPRCP